MNGARSAWKCRGVHILAAMARRERTPPSGTARLAALRMLGRRDYTADEIQTRLIDRGFEDAEVRAAVAALRDERVVDDRRAALAHVRTASRIKGRGGLRIRRELQARGADESAIAHAMATLEPDDEAAAIDRAIARRGATALTSPAERRKLFAQLMRRGFSADAIGKRLRGDFD